MNGSGNAIGGGAAWCSKRIREPWERFCSGWAVPSWNVHRWLLPSLSFFFLYRVIRKSVSTHWEHAVRLITISRNTRHDEDRIVKILIKKDHLFLECSFRSSLFSFYTEWFINIDVSRRLFDEITKYTSWKYKLKEICLCGICSFLLFIQGDS